MVLLLVFFAIVGSGCSSDTSSGDPDADGSIDGNSDGQAGDDGGLDSADEPGRCSTTINKRKTNITTS